MDDMMRSFGLCMFMVDGYYLVFNILIDQASRYHNYTLPYHFRTVLSAFKLSLEVIELSV